MSGLHAASCVSLGRRMGALGFVLACMAIWHTATLQEFRVGHYPSVRIQVLLCFIGVRVTSTVFIWWDQAG
jgi:hypothetical protein